MSLYEEFMGPKQYAYYPFLKDSMIYIMDQNISLDELIKKDLHQSARSRGKKRAIMALFHLTIDSENLEQPNPMADEGDYIDEILSYVYSRILVSSINDRTLTRRYVLAEAKTLNARLSGRKPGIGDDEIIELISDRLDVRAELESRETVVEKNRTVIEDFFLIHFTSFLKHTTQFKDRDWKLINQEIRNGKIELTRSKLIRIIEQALFEKMEKEMPLPVPDRMRLEIKNDLVEVKRLLEEWKSQNLNEDFGNAEMDCLPPCMIYLVNMVKGGENLPHTGRFALTSFLSNIGLKPEEILLVFSASPDYDRSKTEYQVNHITGETSGTKYTPPECATMKSYGICYNPDGLCNHPKINHPLSYYIVKKRGKERDNKRAEKASAPKAAPSSISSEPAAQQ